MSFVYWSSSLSDFSFLLSSFSKFSRALGILQPKYWLLIGYSVCRIEHIFSAFIAWSKSIFINHFTILFFSYLCIHVPYISNHLLWLALVSGIFYCPFKLYLFLLRCFYLCERICHSNLCTEWLPLQFQLKNSLWQLSAPQMHSFVSLSNINPAPRVYVILWSLLFFRLYLYAFRMLIVKASLIYIF